MEQYINRKYIIGGIILLIGLIFTFRLFFLQVINSTYKLSAESNTRRMEIVYAARGLIFDRNGIMIAHNLPSYDLKIAPYELEAFDSTELCEILQIDINTLREGIIRVKSHPNERFNPFIKQLSSETFGILKEKQFKFPGFYFSIRTLREYDREIAAHLLGYVGEVDSSIILKNPYYELGDYIGVSGIEFSYEEILKGEKGRKYKLIDVHGREQGSYKDGRYDTDAKPGKNITVTIDADLQEYGEQLMHNYEGSIVAIEPSTGEILAFISTPTYNPSLLVGRQREENYFVLKNDTLEPLFNHAIQALYPPGSTFKTVNALIALQENVITNSTTYYCDLGYYARGVKIACHAHDSPLDLVHAIQQSCNAYFCNAFRKIIEDPDFESVEDAYTNWRNHLVSMGFTQPLGVDLPYEKGGLIPKPDYYDRYYGKNRWKALTIISMAIGQGEVLTTPLQIANLAALISNRGYYYIPHVVKKIEGIDTIRSKFILPNYSTIDTNYYKVVVNGMEKAVNESGGTATWVRHKDIIICGKTGTAENPQGEDHSVFMAFAPKDDPKIAIAVYVEHGKWGASYAAPIASLMIEKYLTDSIAPYRKWIERRMLERNLLNVE
ncbi:MAG: penicillin-binding protein 2 [Bacteroidales bacterium]|nr:penicillin-binding protein 2 [Bacteroidales bacterium]